MKRRTGKVRRPRTDVLPTVPRNQPTEPNPNRTEPQHTIQGRQSTTWLVHAGMYRWSIIHIYELRLSILWRWSFKRNITVRLQKSPGEKQILKVVCHCWFLPTGFVILNGTIVWERERERERDRESVCVCVCLFMQPHCARASTAEERQSSITTYEYE